MMSVRAVLCSDLTSDRHAFLGWRFDGWAGFDAEEKRSGLGLKDLIWSRMQGRVGQGRESQQGSKAWCAISGWACSFVHFPYVE